MTNMCSIGRWAAILVLGCFAGVSSGADRYVTPEGAGTYSGADWDNAYSNVQDAVDACIGEASTIYVRYGSYSNDAAVTVENAVNLTIVGGYEGTGTTLSSDPSILTRASGTMRIFYVTNSVLVLERLTVTDGSIANGSGLYLLDCDTTITNCVISDNAIVTSGGGIYASGGNLHLYSSDVSRNTGAPTVNNNGGGIYAVNLSFEMRSCTVVSNGFKSNKTFQGGGVFLNGGDALIEDCSFLNNYIWNTGGQTCRGGALYANSVNPLLTTNCLFEGNYMVGTTSLNPGGVLYINGSGVSKIEDCIFEDNNSTGNALEHILLNNTDSVLFRNLSLDSAGAGGIRKLGSGSLSLSNALIYTASGHGIEVTAGDVNLANVTVSSGSDWGVTASAGTITVVDSIIWGNASGGLAGPTLDVTYSDIQETHAGTGNLSTDPRLISGYYLSVSGLVAQTETSPCFDVGSATSLTLGLNTLSTRTDGALDSGQVDLGFHGTNVLSGSVLSNGVLYVDIVNGDNANNGWSSDNAISNLTEALSRAIVGSTIYVASGTYNVAGGETFPLVSSVAVLSIVGEGPASTILDADGSESVFSASAMASLWLESLSFTDGLGSKGAGIKLVTCATTITNCSVYGNTPNANVYGLGIYASAGSLTILNSDISANDHNTSYYNYGTGIWVENADLTMRSCNVSSNTCRMNRRGHGGGLYISGGSAFIESCSFVSNTMTEIGGEYVSDGAIYANNVDPLTVTNCIIKGNSISSDHASARGAAMGIYGATRALIVDCTIMSNAFVVENINHQDVYLKSTLPIAIRNTIIAEGNFDGIDKENTGSLSMTNCLVYGMASNGVQVVAGTVSIGNTTIADNGNWGITNSAGTVTLKNSIVWGNAGSGLSGCSATYCDSQNAIAGTGNISTDPLFENAGAGDYRLTMNSPCIDNGDNETGMSGALDLGGLPRLSDKTVDMGAYEAPPAPPAGTVIAIR